MNILIVDDKEIEVEVINKLIDHKRLHIPMTIYKAYCMDDAMQIFMKHPVSIMICDIEMPNGNGLDLAKWIRKMDITTEIIYLTGHAEFSYAKTALHFDAVEYLLKPVRKEALSEAIEKAINRLPEIPVENEPDLSPAQMTHIIKDYIKNNFKKEISRKELAAEFYIHPDYLSHIFKEQSGVSLTEYIIRIRIQKAKELLCYTNKTVSAIAAETGYSNTAYFTRHFKRETGLTPKEYRKLQKE